MSLLELPLMAERARVFEYEMGYTEGEFEQVLKGGFTSQDSVFSCRDNGQRHWIIDSEEPPLSVSIQVKQSPPRQLGAMILPVLKVEFCFAVTTDEQVAFFFDRFFKYFHKGGG